MTEDMKTGPEAATPSPATDTDDRTPREKTVDLWKQAIDEAISAVEHAYELSKVGIRFVWHMDRGSAADEHLEMLHEFFVKLRALAVEVREHELRAGGEQDVPFNVWALIAADMESDPNRPSFREFLEKNVLQSRHDLCTESDGRDVVGQGPDGDASDH